MLYYAVTVLETKNDVMCFLIKLPSLFRCNWNGCWRKQRIQT